MSLVRDHNETRRTAAEEEFPEIVGASIPVDFRLNQNASGFHPENSGDAPVWEHQAFLRNYGEKLDAESSIERLSGSGSRYEVVHVIVEGELSPLRDSYEARSGRPLPDIVAEIRSALSLQVKELAEILQVERPTIYAWIKGSSSPQKQNRSRLRQVSHLAGEWNHLSNRPIGQAIRETDDAGRTIVDYMREDAIPADLIRSRFRLIAQAAKQQAAGRKPSVRDLAEKHGIDLSKLRDQQDQIDIITGKRVSMD